MARVILHGQSQRDYARQLISDAPAKSVMTLKENCRSLEQNKRMWAMLADLEKQLELNGNRYSKEDWKHICMSGLGVEYRQALGFQGEIVGLPYGRSSHMTIQQMSDLMEYIAAEGTARGVVFREPSA